jgi:hypothetical protein
LARSKYELTHWAKSILTHYFMEIFVDQTIIKKFALLLVSMNNRKAETLRLFIETNTSLRQDN